MSRGRDIGVQLAAALAQQAAAAGFPITVESQRRTAWASATFIGARHELVLRAAQGDALDRWLAALPEAEFALRGHLVADIAVAGRDAATIHIEALTVEES